MRWGMRPSTLPSALEALDRVRHGEPFDVAVLDMNMPDGDGLDLARQLHQCPGAQALPLARLASTSIADLPHTLQAATAGKFVRAALLAVAGVVESPRMTLTNLPWSIDAAAIGMRELATDVIELRMQRDGEVRRQGPRRGGPDDK